MASKVSLVAFKPRELASGYPARTDAASDVSGYHGPKKLHSIGSVVAMSSFFCSLFVKQNPNDVSEKSSF